MQTFDEYMGSLPVKVHASMMKRLQEAVPLSRNSIYAVRRGKQVLSLATALKVHEVTERGADPRSMTSPDVWDQLDAYYESQKRKRKKTQKS